MQIIHNTGSWWAVALSEAVTGLAPLAACCEGEELVLFRNAEGNAVALEDRCPHRRVPLSAGEIKQGHLQCAYHGWTFDGASGACVAIPNLGAGERVPARHAARAHAVHEANGFVHVWRGAGPPAGMLPAALPQPAGRLFSGSATVSLPRADYLAALLDGPEVLLRIAGVRITDFFLGDPRVAGEHLVLDRGADWAGRRPGPSFVDDLALLLRIAVPLAGAPASVELLNGQGEPLLSLQIAISEHRRHTTRLCWRGHLHAAAAGAGASLRWRLARLRGEALAGWPPFQLFSTIDGAVLAALPIQPSLQWQAARAPAAQAIQPAPTIRVAA